MIARTGPLNALTSVNERRDSAGSTEDARSLQYLGVALLLVITLVAGLTAGIVFGRPRTSATSLAQTGSGETARAFYDAFNQALAGGASDALAALLAPGFLDHDASIGESQNAEEFLDRVGALGQEPGAVLLSVESIETSSSSLIVRVSQAESKPRELAGISVQQQEGSPHFEVLRVARGRVSDRWTPGIQWLRTTDIENAMLHTSGQIGLASTLARAAIPAEAVHWWYPVGPGFLLIESGAARMYLTHNDGDGETLQLERGAAVPVAAGDRVQLRSANGEPVTALAYSVMRRGAAEVAPAVGATDARSRGVAQTMLWSGPFPHSEESAAHRLGTLVLPAGKEANLTGVAGATLLLCIDAGAIEIAAPGGAIAILGDDLWPVEHSNFAGADALHAASITKASVITLRNVSDHTATIVLVVIRIDEQSGPPIG